MVQNQKIFLVIWEAEFRNGFDFGIFASCSLSMVEKQNCRSEKMGGLGLRSEVKNGGLGVGFLLFCLYTKIHM